MVLRVLLSVRRVSTAQASTSADALFSKRPVFPKKPQGQGEAKVFVDYRPITCVGGNGGNGMVSFLRVKNDPFAGPDGGNGGNGAHVIFKGTVRVTGNSKSLNRFSKPFGKGSVPFTLDRQGEKRR